MKLLVLSESPEDEAALRVLIDGILGIETEHVAPPFRAYGWSQLPRVFLPFSDNCIITAMQTRLP